MSEATTSTTDEDVEPPTEPIAEPQPTPADGAEPAGDEATDAEAKPKRTLGLRKPTGPARGAMAAVTMAAVPATGVVGSVVYGNFGAAGLAATAATGLAAGGVALAVRAKRRAEERAKAKDGKAGLPPHTLGGLRGLLAKSKERAAGRRQGMAERRAARQGRGLAGLVGAGGVGRRGAGTGGGVAGRVRSALGGVAGRGRSVGAGAGRAGAGRGAGRPAVGGKPTTAGHAGGGRHAAPGARATGRRPAAAGRGAGRGAGGVRAASGGRAPAAAGRYTNPANGRPMTPRQVASAVRRQQRAQRVVNGNSYPRQVARWAARHPKAVGLAAAGAGGLAAAVMFAPLAAAAAVGLGVFGAARHPAFRNAAFIAGRGTGRHAARFGRWMRSQWLAWRRRNIPEEPLDGELIDEPAAAPAEPDIVDAEVVPDAKTPKAAPALDSPTPTPTPPSSTAPPTGPFTPPHRRRQAALSNRPAVPEPITQENTMRIFDTLTETVAGLPGIELGRGEGGGHDIDRWAESLADFFDALGARINNDAASIAERYPMDSSSQESMGQLGVAVGAFAAQVREHVDQWKSDTSWQYTDNNA